MDKRKIKFTEADLEKATMPFLNFFFEKYCFQVPIYNRVIDLVGGRENKIYSIEYKLKNWQKALIQAKKHRQSVDKSFICIQNLSVLARVKEECARYGIGIMIYDSGKTWVELDAIKFPFEWYPDRDYLKKYLIEN